MRLTELEGVEVGGFKTAVLQSVDQEDVNKIFDESDRIIFLSNSKLTDKVQAVRGINFSGNSAVMKKDILVSKIANCNLTLSSDDCDSCKNFRYYKKYVEGDTVHLPVFYLAGFSRFIQGFITFYYLVKLRKSYDSILFYNFFFQTAIPSLLAKFFLGKKIYVDFEDGHQSRKGFYFEKISKLVSERMLDGAILINRKMTRILPDTLENYCVVNGFIDFSHMKELLDRDYDKFIFIFSGAIDKIRGGDLLIEFHDALEARGIDFEINVTGYGDDVEVKVLKDFSLVNSNFNFYGYLSSRQYSELLHCCNVGVSFQKPNIEFSDFSYPSKVISYTQAQLPVLVIR